MHSELPAGRRRSLVLARSIAWRNLHPFVHGLMVAALLVVIAANAGACRCPTGARFARAYDKAPMIVMGRVATLVANADKNGSTATVTVSQSWKEQAPQTVSVSTSTTCAFAFVQGEEYLIYLYKSPAGGYFTSRCAGNLQLAKASPALHWLKRHGAASHGPSPG